MKVIIPTTSKDKNTKEAKASNYSKLGEILAQIIYLALHQLKKEAIFFKTRPKIQCRLLIFLKIRKVVKGTKLTKANLVVFKKNHSERIGKNLKMQTMLL